MATTVRRTFPFSGVDGMMRVLDEPQRPQTVELEVALTGTVDEDHLRRAVIEAAADHPMARARQRSASPFDLHDTWEIGDTLVTAPVEAVTAGDEAAVDAARDAFTSRHVDVTSEAPFRVLLVHEPHGSRVLLSSTHVAFDGLGALRLLRSISRSYEGVDDPPPRLDPFAARSAVEREGRGPSSRPPTAPAGRTARLPARPTGDGPGFGVLHLDLDVADASAPAGTGATVNDVLLAAVHLATARWIGARNGACDRISTMVPVDRRPASWRGDVVANLVLSGRVTSTATQRRSPADLLAAVVAQTTAIKRDGVAGSADPVPRHTPVLLRRLLPHVVDAAGDRADTTVLSNLGRVDDAPSFGSTLRGLWFGPPPRSPVSLTFGAAAAAGRLGVSLRWCRADHTRADAGELADLFTEALADVRRGPRL